jgi:hypothetical protein
LGLFLSRLVLGSGAAGAVLVSQKQLSKLIHQLQFLALLLLILLAARIIVDTPTLYHPCATSN